MEEEIDVITQSAIRIVNKDGKVVYFDPFRLENKYKMDADIIFITHPHFDHFSPEDIAQIKKDNTKIVAPEELAEKIKQMGFSENDILLIIPNKMYEIEGITFETIPAYNVNKDFHKKEYDWVGYIVTIDEKRVYVAGDTDATIDARNVKCDIALVPIGGTYTMDWREAVELIREINPEIAIPTHYGSIVGSIEDGERFRQALEQEIKVKVFI